MSKFMMISRFNATMIKPVLATALLATAAAIVWGVRRQRQLASFRQRPHAARKNREGRDLVDEASWESFPASDPPATY